MSEIAQTKLHTNFDVVFKHTIKNVYTRVTTYVAYGVFFVISTIMLILIPALLPFKISGDRTVVHLMNAIMEPFSYTTGLVLAVCSSLVASCVLELNETTFELSRPVSRRTFISAKSTVGLISNGGMYIWYIIAFLICQSIIHSKLDIYIFNDKDIHLNYASLLVPSLFVMLFATFTTFLLRPFIIKKDGLISVIIVLVCFLTYQLYPIVFVITNTTSGKDSDMWISCLILPAVVFGVGSICTIFGTVVVYDKLYVKV